MNTYGQMALDHSRRHRPVAFSQIHNPIGFFDEVGEQIAADVTRRRDEILGPRRAGETPEAYRLRSYQALRTAEELTLTDHHLFQDEPTSHATGEWDESPADDPELASSVRRLAEINRAINHPL